MLTEQGALNETDIQGNLFENADDLSMPSTSSTYAEPPVIEPSTPSEEAEVLETSQKRRSSNSLSDCEKMTTHPMER